MLTIFAALGFVAAIGVAVSAWGRRPYKVKIHLDPAIRYDEGLAPLAARSDSSYAPTKRQIAENDYPLPRS